MATVKITPKGTLLLISTEADTAKVTRILLEKEGYKVILAQSAADGIKVIARNDAALKLCLLDLAKVAAAGKLYDALARKPAGKDVSPDAETLADDEIRDEAIPILFVAQNEAGGQEAIKTSGLVGAFIVKPYDKDDLIEKVEQLLSAG